MNKNKKIIVGIIGILLLIITILVISINKTHKVLKSENINKAESEELEFSYEMKYINFDQEKVKVLITITGSMGITEIHTPDENNIIYPNEKNVIAMDYEVLLNKEYKFIIKGKEAQKVGIIYIKRPVFYKNYEICNISPYGFDVYIYDVSPNVLSITDSVYAEENGASSKITSNMVRLSDNKTYYLRVNINQHNNKTGKYYNNIKIKIPIGQDEEIIDEETIVPELNTTIKTLTAESLIVGVRDNEISTGYYDIDVNGETYNLEVLNLKETKNPKKNGNTYEIRDLVVGTCNVGRTAVIKCDEKLVINGKVTTQIGIVNNISNLTRVKGLFICSKGDFENNGEITMTARGTYNTIGQNIYLWKNKNVTDTEKMYEYIPAVGANGGNGVYVTGSKYDSKGSVGEKGKDGTNRSLGGGGSGRCISMEK